MEVEAVFEEELVVVKPMEVVEDLECVINVENSHQCPKLSLNSSRGINKISSSGSPIQFRRKMCICLNRRPIQYLCVMKSLPSLHRCHSSLLPPPKQL